MKDRPPDSPRPASPPEPTAPVVLGSQRIRSEELLRGSHELVIEHQGREYRLRLTQNGKLILTA
ncbi:MAG: hemin uptake protein HemP [Burkholderiales bacterium]